MNKVNLQGSAIRINFKFQIDKDFGKGNFTKEEAKKCAEKAGLSEVEFKSIATHVLRHFKVDKNVYSFGDVPQDVKNAQKVQKEALKKDTYVKGYRKTDMFIKERESLFFARIIILFNSLFLSCLLLLQIDFKSFTIMSQPPKKLLSV